ncbi:STAS domain-containing protein [Streptomyces fumanus]|uniref:Anti-sigma factor antagonist n=1 Tax=Streptomyces fumanus TaxID=67302 RepID=A0A919ACI5_9ACTN|nr:STAS domain-containing protein [Streptomyces fumanus]GHE96973.1 anti-sigma factor antagonist [Streptomyces fumanus]
MTDHSLTVTREVRPSGAIVLAVAGELDYGNAERLTGAADLVPFGEGTRVVLDLSGLTYCDSTGITVFVHIHRRAVTGGSRLTLAGVGADLMRVFRIVGLDQLFTFEAADQREADASRPREDA